MTVQFSNECEAWKFAKKCLYVGCCANSLYSNFYSANFLTNISQVQLDTRFTVEEVESILADAKIKFLWVTQW